MILIFNVSYSGFFCRCFAHSFAMQAFFHRVDLAAYRQQQQTTAQYLHEHPPPRALSPPPKRAVGRPKLKREADEVLSAAADARSIAATQANKRLRGEYTRWFDTAYINDILHAYKLKGGSARHTVDYLQKHAPDNRYDRLSHSTVASWFENGRLKPAHQQQLDAGRAHVTYAGSSPALDAAPGASDAICDILLKLREAGTPLNSHVIRWVMMAVLRKHQGVLEQLSLSQQFISKWVRNSPRLQFRWRARTTAASKLPDD